MCNVNGIMEVFEFSRKALESLGYRVVGGYADCIIDTIRIAVLVVRGGGKEAVVVNEIMSNVLTNRWNHLNPAGPEAVISVVEVPADYRCEVADKTIACGEIKKNKE